jgi:adenylate cyclase
MAGTIEMAEGRMERRLSAILAADIAGAQQLALRIARNPGTDASRMLLASCYGHLGRAEDARAAWSELLEVNPDFSLAQRARVLPHKDAGDFQRFAEGLAKAGLP